MADKLSERLNDAWRKLYADGDEHDVCDTIAEAAELARRFEEAPEAFYRGHRIRMVPDTHTPPDPGHEREVPDGSR